ncbi:MAG: FtsX-like permease family protein, partial [Ekhidna sp.]|nr:FtsX-like permease family protein [Ekhidna sp.]
MGNAQPPKWALKFLRWYCREEYLEEIEGDLFEFYYLRLHTSKNSADLFFIWNVMRSFRLINFKKTGLLNNWTMNLFKNYTKIYFRRFRRETSHFLVNIIGLGMGFSILFYILMYVHDEQSIDGFHSKKDRIYRIVDEQKEEDGIHQYVSTPGPLAEALKNEYPSIEEAAHLTYSGSQLLAVGEIRLDDRQWAMASKEIFDILDIEIIAGNPRKEFPGMAGMVVTEDLALRLFGSVDVVGEMVEETNFGPTEVLAVMKQMPKNSSYKFHNIYVTNYEQFPAGWKNFIGSWRGRFTETWVLTNENTDLRNHEVSQDFLSKYLSDDAVENTKYRFQNILDIHLGSEGIERGGMSPRLEIPYSNPSFLSMILWMGLLVLFIAALNYINLSSVQALRRTLEASMRKINGAGNKHLLIQLFFETLLTVMIAYTVAMVLVIIFFPFFLDVAKKELELSLLFSVDFIAYHLGAILIIWFASALLPAIYYSQLKRQLLVLKNAFSGKGDLLRKVLVGVQYALAIFLIIGSLVIYRQLNYVQSKDLGFELDKLITLDINSGAARREFKNIVNGLLENPNVVNASTSSRVPGEWKNIPIAMVGVTQT